MIEGDLTGKFIYCGLEYTVRVRGKTSSYSTPNQMFWDVVCPDGKSFGVHEKTLREGTESLDFSIPPGPYTVERGKIDFVVCSTCQAWKIGKEQITVTIPTSATQRGYGQIIQTYLRDFFRLHKDVMPYVYEHDGKIHLQFIERGETGPLIKCPIID